MPNFVPIFKIDGKKHKEHPKSYQYLIGKIVRRSERHKSCSTKLFRVRDFGSYFTFQTSAISGNRLWTNSSVYHFQLNKEGFLQINRPLNRYRYYIQYNPDEFLKILIKKIKFGTKECLHKQFKKYLLLWLSRQGKKVPRKHRKLNLNQLILVLAYPGIEYLWDFIPDRPICYLHPFYSNCFKNANGINHILKRISGTSGKTVKNFLKDKKISPYVVFLYCRLFKGILPLESIAKIINENKDFSHYRLFLTKKTRAFFKKFHKDTILKFLNNKDYDNILYDTLFQYNKYKSSIILPESNNIREIHDDMARQIRCLQHKNVIFRSEQIQKALKGLEIGSLRFEVPTDSEKLLEYGKKMSNCIYTYKDQVANGSVIILGIYDKDELKYNISIKNNKIQQFYGKYNRDPNPDDKAKVLNTLFEKKLLDVVNV